jgi:lipopolysaccharide transport system ATP-binding protein
MRRPIIDIRHVSKAYRLGVIGATSLKDELARLWERARGRRTGDRARAAQDFWALRDVSFAVQPGEVVGIIGRNGAGKSTLLKILSRITQQTSGEITLRGRVASLLEVGTGFHPDLTGRENIFLNGAILGMTRDEIRTKFDEIVAFAEVEPFIDTPVKRYSSGMYVRLAFAVAAHLEPEILIVDEVLAVGDAAFQAKCLGRMRNVASEGRTVLFVSHSMGAIGQLCNRCILLDGGQVHVDADTATAVASYLGSAYTGVGEREFPPDAAKRVQIRRVRLIKSGELPATVLDVAQKIRTEIEFDVRETTVGAAVGWMIEKPDGTPICHSNARDGQDVPEPLIWLPGEYRATVEFPGGVLNAGAYTIRVGIGIIGPHSGILDHQECFLIHLHDSGSFGAISTGGKQRLGVLLLRLPWQTERLASGSSSPCGARDGDPCESTNSSCA